jgi:hypothetical protein
MKLCPQCDFIYEDDQGFCDMDGKELVHDSASQAVDPTALSKLSTNRSRSKRVPALLAGAAVLAALLSVIYLVQRHLSQLTPRSEAVAIPIQSLQQPNANEPNPQTSPANYISETETSQLLQPADASLPSAGTDDTSADASITNAPHIRATEASARAAADVSANRSGTVIVRLTNGATIKADDAGATKTGFWYRQGGMVTFLERNQVRAIERRRASSSPSNASADNRYEKTASARAAAGQNQLRLRRLEPATVKRESRVTSFLKKTGQILSRPFKR